MQVDESFYESKAGMPIPLGVRVCQTNNGVTYREAMRKVLAVNGLSLPDENIQLELDFE